MNQQAGGFFRAAPQVPARDQLTDLARMHVRAGLLDGTSAVAEVEAAIVADLPSDPDPAGTAGALVDAARAELLAEQLDWRWPTDYQRLQEAFTALGQRGVVVLQAVEDHWVADAALRQRSTSDQPLAGLIWFTAPDVWHAVDHGMLELNVWHADSANVAPGEVLLDVVVAALADHGLAAHFDEGRVEVAAHWQRPLLLD